MLRCPMGLSYFTTFQNDKKKIQFPLGTWRKAFLRGSGLCRLYTVFAHEIVNISLLHRLLDKAVLNAG